MDKVNILGTDYEILDGLEDERSDGCVYFYRGKIYLRNLDRMLEGENDATLEEKKMRRKEILRHEILHAYLYECGAEKYAYDERLIDILMILFPKMLKTFQEVDAI